MKLRISCRLVQQRESLQPAQCELPIDLKMNKILFILSMIFALGLLTPGSFAASVKMSPSKEPQSSTSSSKTSTKVLTPEDPSLTTVPSANEASPSALPNTPSIVVDAFAPFTITLQSKQEATPLPSWAIAPIKVNRDLCSVEFPLPALTEQLEIENFSLTVNFNDHGDGGPVVEWSKPHGERVMICSGLGTNGPALGPNSRTILIPNDLALDGGSVIVTHAGRFEQLLSLTIRPGRTAMVAVLGGKNSPALVDESLKVVQKDLVEGGTAPLKKGDFVHGCIISAELKARVEQLHGNEIEFVVPLQGELPEATMLHTELMGLNLESQVEVQVNGISIGTLNTPDFKLDAPELIKNNLPENPNTPNFQFAGWRDGSLYLPARVWKEGDNSLVFLVKQQSGAPIPSSLLSLRNTTLDLRYATTPTAKNLFRF